MLGHARLCIAFALLALALAYASTPVAKVTELLENLAKKVEQEGKDEAAAYDKYACFCKEQADQKQYAIESSGEKIEHLIAEIAKLTGEISALDGEIQGLGTEITRLEGVMADDKTARDAERTTFQTDVAEASKALDAVERAIQALKDSKKAQIGKAELEVPALSQVGKIAQAALPQHTSLTETQASHLSFLAGAGEPGKAYTYKYRSNDIISTLQNLRTTFADRKATLEDDEFKAQSAHELNRQDLSNQKKFAEKEKREKEEVHAAKTVEKTTAETDKTDEEKDKTSDEAFLGVLQTNCQDTAALWDQRSQTRSAELTAISQALATLKTGVAPNWQANKKLSGLQKKHAVKEHRVTMAGSTPAKPTSKSVAFLQVQGVSLRGSSQTSAQLVSRVEELLVHSAAKLQSPFLSVAALKIRSAEDHFVKVRQIINDLISHLEDQATAEADHKTFCDGAMTTAVEQRDQQQTSIEDNEAQVATKESEKVELKNEVAELSKQIAENKKALHEATQLREVEKKENDKTVKDAGAGKAAVELAISTLNAFYDNAALLQRSNYVPPDSDREGKTVADRAPEVFDSEYKGSQDASKGIIGILEVILSDFERTETNVAQQESAAQGRFDSFESTNTQDTATKQDSVDTKTGEIEGIDSDLVALKDSLHSAEELHKSALAELEQLHSSCVAGEETYAERAAQREKEVEALKQALTILENFNK